MGQVLYVMQGAPGSGKSTLAEKIKDGDPKTVICSTDQYHYMDGVYKFDASKLGRYHQLNLEKAKNHLMIGNNVIFDNTNIKRWQCREIVKFALERQIQIVFVSLTGAPYQNVHEVPKEVVDRMLNEMETLNVQSILESKAPWET